MTESVWISRQASRRLNLAEWLTIERAAYGVIAALALGVRLWGLAWQPLSPAEAAQALPALAAATGRAYDLADISPLLFTLQRLLLIPFGATEALARWWPALLGGLSPLLFYALRGRLTRGGALMAALLWALSPMAVWTSRQGVGNALTPALTLALLACLAAPRLCSRRLTLAAVALGLLLASGPAAYTVLLVAVAVLIWQRDAAARIWREVCQGRQDTRSLPGSLLLAAVLALAISSTFFFVAPSGLAAAADLLGAWLWAGRPGAGEYGAWDILRRLLLSEPLLLGFGAAGMASLVGGSTLRRNDRFGRFAALAVGVTLLMPVIGVGRHPADLALVALALSLLAGPVVAQVLRNAWAWRRDLDPWLLASLSAILLFTAAICLPSAYSTWNNADWRALYTGVGIVTAALAVLLWLVYGVWGSWDTVVRAWPVVPLLFLLAWSIGQVSGLSYDRDAGRRAAVVIETPSPNLAEFRSTLRYLAALKGGGPQAARVDLVMPAEANNRMAAVLRWELRNYAALRVLGNLPPDPAPIVVTPADLANAPAEHYSGVNFTVLERWRPEGLKGFTAWLRWLLYREADGGAQKQDAVVWVDRATK
ncbi:MAG: hypothetical protein FJ011_20110 [Chloroflexi bacterium]|nr:hypothetical protein [Chloroflexota bacterium]